MKKGRIIFAALLALFLVVGIGIVSVSLNAGFSECDCWGNCYYCDWETDKCTGYDGPGACFCDDEDGCELNPRRLCCAAS